ncbi:MAG: 50S ribosomal protein L23 [Candidatus Marsarchaeota archaeon]|nr:50S ribosomal protein L23 [Candidatus Marsarchaeota archaeon]MCL5412995.1 50S ribosomal protein L23 [Candidatus Marsarchaeota archaeon]
MVALLYPISTEKALNMIDRNNTITYVVDFRSRKDDIRKEFEETFGVKVDRINTAISIKNNKRAYIRMKKEFKASDVARKLKLV